MWRHMVDNNHANESSRLDSWLVSMYPWFNDRSERDGSARRIRFRLFTISVVPCRSAFHHRRSLRLPTRATTRRISTSFGFLLYPEDYKTHHTTSKMTIKTLQNGNEKRLESTPLALETAYHTTKKEPTINYTDFPHRTSDNRHDPPCLDLPPLAGANHA